MTPHDERDHWVRWHDAYEDPASGHSRRLRAVQDQLRAALDRARPGAIRVLSLCAGQGRDLLDVLLVHPRARDVHARLIELNPDLAAAARLAASRLTAGEVEVLQADAGLTDAYRGATPADILLLAGIFGNVADSDIERTAGATAMLCAAGATVIWTRHRRPPDATPVIRAWYARAAVDELAFVAPADEQWSVWAGRFTGTPTALRAGERLFAFR